MKSAIVTGANGFVGAWLLRELSQQGVKTYAVVRDMGKADCIRGTPGVEIVLCDMENIAVLPELVDGEPEVFYHLAWSGSTGAARADYALQLQNVKWALDAVDAAKALGSERFVGAGTLAELDVNAYSPLDGSTPSGVSCYGAAKIAAHLMSKAECNAQGVEHLWAYLSNTYGEGNYTSNFVNFASKTMLTGKPANFTSGEQPYDFVYVGDTARGLYCVGDKGKVNCSYYIGSTKPRKLKEYVCAIRDAIDPAIQLNLGAVPFNGVMQPANVFDCTKLVEDTGYEPKMPFEQGIRVTVDWLRRQIEEGKI